MAHASRMDLLVEAIYDAVLDPEGWSQVGALLKEAFHSSVEALYLLGYERGGFQPLHVAGVDDEYFHSFPEHFFCEDNPFVRSEPLHRPGVVRTDGTVQQYLGDAHVLHRSRYYNDWMRPQDLAHTLGTTLDQDGATITNLSLLRPAGLGPFNAREVAAFGRVAGHLRRSVRIAARLETLPTREAANLAALDALAHGVLFLDLRRRPIYCNRVAESTLREGGLLRQTGARLRAAAARDESRLDALLTSLEAGPDTGGVPVSMSLSNGARTVHLVALRLSCAPRWVAAGAACTLVLLIDPQARERPPREIWRERYGLTAVEAALTEGLVAGQSLREVAGSLAITYETARWYLKIVFHKTGVTRQAELVSRLLCQGTTNDR